MAMTIATGIGIGIGIGIQSTVLWDLRNRYYSATELNTETRFRKGEMIWAGSLESMVWVSLAQLSHIHKSSANLLKH